MSEGERSEKWRPSIPLRLSSSAIKRLPSFHLRRTSTSDPLALERSTHESPHALVRNGNRKSLQSITKYFGDGFLHTLDDNARTPLHIAAMEGDLEILKFLLERGQSMESGDENGWTALHHACACGHLDVAMYLIAAGADGWDVTYHNETVLHILLQNKSLNEETREFRMIVQNILSRPDEIINFANAEGSTILHFSVQRDMLWTTEQLLGANCFPNGIDKMGDTPLHIAVRSKQIDMVNLLLRYGANPDCSTEVGRPIDQLTSGGSRIKRMLQNATPLPPTRSNGKLKLSTRKKSAKNLIDLLESTVGEKETTRFDAMSLRPRAKSHSSRAFSKRFSRSDSLLDANLRPSREDKSPPKPEVPLRPKKGKKKQPRKLRQSEGSYTSNDGSFILAASRQETIRDSDRVTERINRSVSQKILPKETISISVFEPEVVTTIPTMLHEEIKKSPSRPDSQIVDPVVAEQKITANPLYEQDEDLTDDSDETQLHFLERQLNQSQSKAQQLENELRMTQNLLRKTQRRLGERDRRINELENLLWRNQKHS